MRNNFIAVLLSFVLFNLPLAVRANSHHEVVILGGGPAGLSAAIYTSRAGLSTTVIQGREPGGQIALSYSVENFPGFPEGISGFDLAFRMQQQAEKFGAKVKQDEVFSVDLTTRPFKLRLEEEGEILADTLIIATGASAKWLGIPSEQALIGKGVGSCAVCDAALYKDKDVVVVGGGDVALEDALFLTNYANQVTVVHRRDTLKASKPLQDRALVHPKIKFVWDSVVESVMDPSIGEVTGVAVKNSRTGERRVIPCDGLFIAIGHTPNTALFRGKLALSSDLEGAGYVIVKPLSTATSVPGVFAAGDVADEKYRQAITAAGTGAMAGMDAYHFIQENKTPKGEL